MGNKTGMLPLSVSAILAIATLVYRLYGSSVAVDRIYLSWWFLLVWIVFIGVSAFVFIRHKNLTKPVLLLHSSVLFILLGALVTRSVGENGSLHVRIGMPAVCFLDNQSSDCYNLPFSMRLDAFAVVSNRLNRHPTDYVSRITILDRQQQIRKTISVNRPLSYRGYRFLQGGYDEDRQGVMLLVNHDPWGIWLVYGGYLLFLIGGVWWLVARGERFRVLSRSLSDSSRRVLRRIFVVTVLLLPLAVMVRMELHRASMPPVLLSGWLRPHVWTITAAYALFFGLLLLSLLVEVCYHKGQDQRVKTLTIMSKVMLCPAIILLGIGICLGSVWANDSWGSYWSWDPKEVWALITLLVYTVAAHADTIPWLHCPIRFHRYLLFAFLSVLLTYWGVNCYLGGMHSYGP
ncbi:MAG: ABC-type transport system involved in cytochrome c biosis, permease component [Bacteroidetes bacterium]|nr:ABC-type transport system involved in cytochrome c biosis, permease component [Bacteroidota bacterium]